MKQIVSDICNISEFYMMLYLKASILAIDWCHENLIHPLGSSSG